MSRLDEFYQQHPDQAPFAPVAHLAQGRERYARQAGLGPIGNARYRNIEALPRNTQRIAREYNALPEFDRAAIPSFQAMKEETGRQFDFLTGRKGLGIDVEISREDPYSGPQAARNDVVQNNRLKVLSTKETGGHPFFSDDDNDMFRAVHDAFGHLATGRGFDRHGEEAAWTAHSRMYTPAARPAMTSETRGQNSAFIASGGTFPPQKVALLGKQWVDR